MCFCTQGLATITITFSPTDETMSPLFEIYGGVIGAGWLHDMCEELEMCNVLDATLGKCANICKHVVPLVNVWKKVCICL